ncbi:MAG TPA: DUF4912 domain-containing protein [Planctomycetaceae bacterium]|nr:DUF4912 domain-containing protein [Planctomycetaceae bacterium]
MSTSAPPWEQGGEEVIILVMNAANLRARTVKELAAMAKREGVLGWHAMRKEQLIRAILKSAKPSATRHGGHPSNGRERAESENGEQKRGANGRFQPKKAVYSPRTASELRKIRAKLAHAKDLAHKAIDQNRHCEADRLVVMVRDAYWLQAYWELTARSIDRAEAALGRLWHDAKPILRLSEIARGGESRSVRTTLRDIEIHGAVDNWYIDVPDPPRRFQVEIGYLAPNGRFLALAKSNIVSTSPHKGQNGAGMDGHWAGVAANPEHIYALSGGYSSEAPASELREVFEQKLRRPMNGPLIPRYRVPSSDSMEEMDGFPLEVDAEVVLFGATHPGAHLTVKGQPIPVRDDGTFTVRLTMPNRRQVLPLVADSVDGSEQRMVVVAIERNTKTLGPVARDIDE